MLHSASAAVLVLCVAALGDALHLPSYLVPCPRNDPDLNLCALKHGRAAISRLVQGDRKYRIPPLEPLIITGVSVEGGAEYAGSTLTFNDMHFYGLSHSSLEDIRIDLNKKRVEWFLTVPRIEISCRYTVKGRVLLFPIVGNGPANITLSGVSLAYSYGFRLENRTDGHTYMQLTDSDLKFDTQRAYIKLENLFNGDKFLGSNMNKFLDENWRLIVKDIGPYIADAIGQAIKQIISSIASLVPYKYMFIE